MKKKLFSCLLVLVLLVTLIPISAFAKLPEGVPPSLEAPIIQKIELKKDEDGVPYFVAQLKIPQSVLQLDSENPGGGSVFWDYAIRIDNGVWSDFGGGGYLNVITETEEANVSGSDNTFMIKFFPIEEGGIEEIDIKNHIYSYKVHFYYDYYEGWPNVDPIYSPASNEVKIGSGSFYFKASGWAQGELEKAADLGLIPDILKGADLTKPITREEFCELSVLMVEKTINKTSEMVAINPFTDTVNPQILKAYKLGITTGTSSTTFSPKVLINREQCAAMLFRAIKAIKPDGNYSIAGVKDFPDQKHIGSWTVDATKYMSKIGIIKGDSAGNFMPKAITTAQEATGYGMATREAAVLMTVRSYEKVPSIPTDSNTYEKQNSSNKAENGNIIAGIAPKNISIPSMLKDMPIATDASIGTASKSDGVSVLYWSNNSAKSLFNIYSAYLKGSKDFFEYEEDGEYYVTGIKNGYIIAITVYDSDSFIYSSEVAFSIKKEE